MRASTLAERVATGFAVVGVLGFAAVILIVRGSSAGFGSASRSAAEQSRLLASGDCALAPDRAVLGKVAGRLGPSRAMPRGGYVLESIDRHRVFQVEIDAVRLVPCRSLGRPVGRVP